MNVGIFLNYIGLGSNLLHLSYCHEIAKKYGPVTIITLCKNLEQALEDDPNIKKVVLFKKYRKITEIPNIAINLKKLLLDKIFIFYPSPRLFLAAKFAGIKKIYNYPLFKKKGLHLVNAAKKLTSRSLNVNFCPTETSFIVSNKKINNAKKYFNKDNYNIIIGAGSSGPDTRWGEKNFISLINRLNEVGNFFFYIQCGPEQNEISRNIIANVRKKNCIDLSKMDIREIIPILYLCDMYVGNDSFSHHVTSQCNKPSIVLLLNSPKSYSDYSINHHRIIPDNAKIEDIDHTSRHDANSISMEKVFNKIIKLKN
tara:strand:- start:521 stop:1456 length:936 start_codon:yes stop_codon:yes gene_type:complete